MVLHAYETIFVLDPQLEDEPIQKEIARVEQLITSHHGEVVSTERWGRRKLGYEIGKRQQGFYTLIRFNAASTVSAELGRVFKLNEAVLRHLIVQVRNHDQTSPQILDDEEPYESPERRGRY